MHRAAALALALFSSWIAPSWASAQREDAPTLDIADVALQRGAGDRASAVRMLRRHQARLRYCHASSAARGEAREGRIVFSIRVAETGAVTSAAVRRRTFDEAPSLEACLTRHLGAIRSPPSEAEATWSVTLELALGEEPSVDPVSVRAEADMAREQARCLVRSAARVESLVAAWSRASGQRRARLARELEAARAALGGCTALGRALIAPATGESIGPSCVGCLGVRDPTL